MTLVLEADLHILHERYMNRMKYENRHPVHMSARQDRFEDFKDYVECARKEGTVGTEIKICPDCASIGLTGQMHGSSHFV